MTKKTKIILTASTLAILSLMVTAYHWQTRIPPNQPDVRPVSAVTEGDGDKIPSTSEIDFESQNPQATKEISDPTDTGRGKPTLEQLSAENTDKITAVTAEKEEVEVLPTATATPTQNTAEMPTNEPKMGDTRVVDGQKQVYFLGFGWIEDNGGGSYGIIAEDLYENGNKIGSMGGTVGHSDGDINKMVDIMD